MAKCSLDWDNGFEQTLRNLANNTPELLRRAVYAGAEVCADELKRGLNSIPSDTFRYLYGNDRFEGIPEDERESLREHFGITKVIEFDDGGVNARIGFEGYTPFRTKKYPQGVPTALIARSINAGSSVRRRVPFIDDAKRAAKDKAQKAMEQELARGIDKNIKED